jgi:hypothetical protein
MKESDMHKVMILTAVVALALVIGGCTPAEKQATKAGTELAMKYAVGQTGTYTVVSESWRTAKFEGPELSKEPKLKSGRTGGALQMTYTQEITAVNADGNAAAKVTLKSLKYDSESSSEVTHAFDSTRDADKGNALAKLVGTSYTIKLKSNGTAEADDMTALRGAVAEGSARDIVTVLFSDKEIARLHTVAALPDSPKQKVGGTWSKTEPSPRGMMDSKNFEKIYTLTSLKDGMAVVEMKAVPSTKPAEKGEVNSQAMMMSMFSSMMETKDSFTGKLLLSSDGSLKSYNETLDAQWFATDPAAKPDKEPDKITMGFLQKHTIDKVN